jgi:hypothetical protein
LKRLHHARTQDLPGLAFRRWPTEAGRLVAVVIPGAVMPVTLTAQAFQAVNQLENIEGRQSVADFAKLLPGPIAAFDDGKRVSGGRSVPGLSFRSADGLLLHGLVHGVQRLARLHAATATRAHRTES